MDIIVTLIGRPAAYQEFAVLAKPVTLALPGSEVCLTPEVPEGAEGDELRLRVEPADTIIADIGTGLDPANPLPADTAPALEKSIGVWGGHTRDIPFAPGTSFRFRV